MKRSDIEFKSGGLTCAGWFFDPETDAPGPCIVMAHGLGAIKEMRLDAYAERFSAEGYRVLVFDYRHFGGSEGEPRQLLDIGRQLQDWRSAITHARNLDGVDPDRIILWGSSLSGGHVMEVAAGDDAVAAVIAQVPHAYALSSLQATGLWHGARLAPHGLYDGLKGLLGLKPHYIDACGPPGSLAIMTAPEALQYLDLVPETYDFDKRIAARFLLQVMFYSPAAKLNRIKAPVLMQVAWKDQTTPPGAAIAAAKTNRRVKLKSYDVGHFKLYLGDWFETTVADQIAFLNSHFQLDGRAAA